MHATGEIIPSTIGGLVSLAVLVIMVKYLLWPLFQKQPLVMGIAFVIVIGMIAVMVMFGL